VAVTITGDRAANLDLCLALMAFSSWVAAIMQPSLFFFFGRGMEMDKVTLLQLAVRVLLRATPAETWDLGLYDLI
jgi:hypothetical protein